MLRPLIERPRRSVVSRQRERGVTMALVALAIFSLIAMAALSIDFGTLYEASAEAQRAADAAALAAARTISMSGITGDPGDATNSWQQICDGAASPASQTAIVVAQQSTVGGAALAPVNITVTYSAGSAASSGGSTICSSLAGTSFGSNPVVTVKVQQPNLQTYFSRIWGATGHSVSATASAEVFNPSGSDMYAGQVVPVQPRCVKPWMVPNLDPDNTPSSFVSTGDGTIMSPGVAPEGRGVIGERFWLVPDCSNSTTVPCPLFGQPQANGPNLGGRAGNLQYVPAQTNFSSIAVPADGSAACTNVAGATAPDLNYSEAIAGCDQSTQYQCGKIGANVVDLSVNPTNDTINGTECLIHAAADSSAAGQDWLAPFLVTPSAPPTYPFQIQAGTNNPLVKVGLANYEDVLTSSTSIVSLPIYDNTGPPIGPATTSVTVVGFLQVFVYAVDPFGDLELAVMNVSGCGNGAPNPNYLTGTSPVPVRLITPP